MREVKFRVYDKGSSWRPMHIVGEDTHDDLTCFDGVVEYRNLQNGEGSGEHGDYTLMQYTGLTDKHGQEIYECDVVSNKWHNPLADRPEDDRYYVEFKNGMYRMFDIAKRPGRDRFLWMQNDRVEVIGNKFEHPHLLQEA
jgi:uncharacterized phage protein (TIGR01671 family)